LPVTRYCYRAVKGYGDFKYRLNQIKRSEQSLYYPIDNIQKASPNAWGLKQLSRFNQLYVPQCNSISLQFAFTEDDESESVFSLVLYFCCFFDVFEAKRHLQGDKLWRLHEPLDFGAAVCEWQDIKNSELSFSVMAMIHSLVETNNGFFHVGISLVPSCGMFIPLWISNDTMQKCLKEWTTSKMPHALTKSLVTVAYKAGNVNVHTARGFHTTMALRSYQPWLVGDEPMK